MRTAGLYQHRIVELERVEVMRGPQGTLFGRNTNGGAIQYTTARPGDIFSQTSYPLIDLESGGSIDGVLDALNYVLDLAIPEFRTEGGTMIVPAYGRLSDSADVGYYRDIVTIIRERVAKTIERGMSLDEIQAARPTRAYDLRFADEGGRWTSKMFVEAVYRSLSENAAGDR